MTNIISSLTGSYSFESTNNQLSIASNTTNITTSSLIGPFKNDLEVDKFNVLLERVGTWNASNAFKMPFFRTRVINKQIIDALIRSLFSNIQNTRASDRAALQTWVFGCYRDYNASMRRELRKLVPEFIRKYRLTKSKQPTMQQITGYITESNWIAFLKRHMDVTDNTLEMKRVRTKKMTQRIALRKHITINISSVIQREEYDNSESLEDLSDKSQHTNYETSLDFYDFVSNFSTASDTSSNDDQLMIIEEIERIIEPTQTI
ncbi:6265_t:CDS:2, partial [Funneliformis caledonium]